MDARFKDILENFKMIQDDNEAKAEAEKYSKWSWVLWGLFQTNCLKSPDGRTIRHGHNGFGCNCRLKDDLLLSQYTSGQAHIWVSR